MPSDLSTIHRPPNGCQGLHAKQNDEVYLQQTESSALSTFCRCAVENMAKTTMVTANAEGVHHSQYSYSFPDRFREAYQVRGADRNKTGATEEMTCR